ncbi:MAG: cytidylate kinase family protein [Candidatus Micrarchaeia archaeon]
MIITISGLSGCGKDTVGALVAKALGLRHIRFSFKDEAARRGISLMELQRLATKNPRIDREFDTRLVKEARKGNCVVTTWLGSWLVKNSDLRVWLAATEKTRAARIAKREGISLARALSHLRARDANNRARYKKLYGIDLSDHSIFDLEIHTDRLTPKTIAHIIICAAKEKIKRR